jgi:hypothetical protein
MTVPAIDTVVADVVFVAELNRLLAREISLSVVRGPVEFEQQPDNQSNEEERAEDGDLRNEVRTSVKDLPHLSARLRTELETSRDTICASSLNHYR